MRQQFLAGAHVVLDAVGDARVAAAWDEPSVLDDQTVGGLAGHLARGSVWAVEEYLDHGSPDAAPDFETAASYFATMMSLADDTMHAGIRRRGAEIASRGHAEVVGSLRDSIDRLTGRLGDEPADRKVAVIGGLVMRLDDYLWTRIVEQVVHLDDLARSLDVEPWRNPPDADALALACAVEIGRLRHGAPPMIRALFRDDSSAVPVI